MTAAAALELELESYERWARRDGRLYEFERLEDRNSSRGRLLDCGHRIDRSEPYRYWVGKVPGERGVAQRRDCDVCRRKDDRY